MVGPKFGPGISNKAEISYPLSGFEILFFQPVVLSLHLMSYPGSALVFSKIRKCSVIISAGIFMRKNKKNVCVGNKFGSVRPSPIAAHVGQRNGPLNHAR
jgi:hypothetical protein